MSLLNITFPTPFPPLTTRKLVIAAAFAFCGLVAVSIGIGYMVADRASVNLEQNSLPSGALADFQKMNAADRTIVQRIRRSIHQDRTLSPYAPNIAITSQHGKVILSGRIRTDDERDYLEAKAAAVAGQGNVINELQVGRSE